MTSAGHTFYVYEHWRLDRDECFYVGKGKGNRAYSLKSRNKHHQAICAKLRRNGFAFEVRFVAVGIGEQEAFSIEKDRIKFWRETGIDLANVTDGGEGNSGTIRSEELRRRISEANKGKKRSEETKRKLREARKRWTIKEETKLKISQALKGRPAAFKGRKHTPETLKILSEKAKIRGAPKLSPEVIEKIATWHRGKKRSDETRTRISAAKKGKPSPTKGKPSKLRGRVLSNDTKEKMSAAKKEYWENRRAKSGGKIVGRKLSEAEKANLSAKKKAYWARKKEVAANDI